MCMFSSKVIFMIIYDYFVALTDILENSFRLLLLSFPGQTTTESK